MYKISLRLCIQLNKGDHLNKGDQLRERQHAYVEECRWAQLSKRTSFFQAVQPWGIWRRFGRRPSGDVRHHSSYSPRQARSFSISPSPVSTNNTVVRRRMRCGQAQDKSTRTALSKDSARWRSHGLDHSSAEEASVVRTESEWILGEENHW